MREKHTPRVRGMAAVAVLLTIFFAPQAFAADPAENGPEISSIERMDPDPAGPGPSAAGIQYGYSASAADLDGDGDDGILTCRCASEGGVVEILGLGPDPVRIGEGLGGFTGDLAAEDRFGSAAEMSARLTAFVRRMKPNYTSANVVEVMASLYPDVVAEPQSGFTKLGSMSSEDTNSAALPLPTMDRESFELGSDSEATCTGTASCDVKCDGGCTVDCRDEAVCTLSCTAEGCAIERCEAGVAETCSDGKIVCGTGC